MLLAAALIGAGITGSAVLSTRQMAQVQQEGWRVTMQTQLEGVAEQSGRWLREREEAARAAAGFEPIITLYTRLGAVQGWEDGDKVVQWRADLKALLAPTLHRNGIVGFVLTTRRGRVLADSGTLAGGFLDSGLEQDLLQKSLTGPAYSQITLPMDWRLSRHFGHQGPVVLASAAVWPRGVDLEPGVLFLVIDPKVHFDEIFLHARIGRSGETYGISGDGRFVTPPRFEPARLATGGRASEPAQAASSAPPAGRWDRGQAQSPQAPAAALLTRAARELTEGRSGADLEGYLDYRGAQVLGMWRWDPHYRFGVITEVDLEEAYASVHAMRRQTALTILSTLVLTGALLGGFIWWTRRMTAAQERLQAEQERSLALAAAAVQAEQAVRQSEAHLRTLNDAFPGYLAISDKQHRYLYINRVLADMLQREPEDVVGRHISEVLEPATVPEVERDFAFPPGHHAISEHRMLSRGGRRIRYLERHRIVGPVNADGSGINFSFGFDVTHARRGQEFEAYRSGVMQMLTQRMPLEQVLRAIVQGLETMAVPSCCSLFLLDAEGVRLTQGLGPQLSAEFLQALEGRPIGAQNGSCARAAATGQRVVAVDIDADPDWAPLRDVASGSGLKSCWSQPIVGGGARVLGTLAMYHRERTTPDNLDFYMITEAARLAGLAVDQERTATQVALQQQELLDKQQQLQHTIDSMLDGFIRSRAGDTIDMVNSALVKMLGYPSAEAMLGRPTRDLYVRSEDREQLMSTLHSRGRISQFRCEARRADGSTVWTETSALIVQDGQGQVQGTEAVVRDITQQIEFEQALQDARNTAQAAAEAKGSFLANMSHEIRTPMNAIIGLTELALRTPLTPRQQDYLGKVHVSAHSLLRLLNDILDLSKIESGKLSLERTPFSLDDVLDGVATVLAVQVEERGLELLFERDPKVPMRLLGDPLRLGQVLTNLTNNAKKFTEKGDIVVSTELVERSGDQATLRFAVRDSGIGMTAEQMSRLFQPFAQADDSTTRRFGGTGLGLAISRQIVDMMGGRIWVDSQPGQGSTFSFEAPFQVAGDAEARRLPPDGTLKDLHVLVVDDNPDARRILQLHLQQFDLRVQTADSAERGLELLQQSQADPFKLVLMDYRMPGMDGLTAARRIKRELDLPVVPRVVLVTAASRLVREEEEDLKDLDEILAKPVNASLLFNVVMGVFGHRTDASLRRHRAAAAPALEQLRPVQGARILLVEDNAINQQVAAEMLEQAGFIVEVAGDGEQALTRLSASAYDAVLMDIQMPVMDGYTATARIREEARWKDLPVLAMTANVMDEDRAKAAQVGMNDHVGKPIVAQDLFGKLLKWIPHGQRPLPEGFTRGEARDAGEVIDLPASIPGMDLARALLNVAGNRTLLRKLLVEFVPDHGGDVVALRAGLAAGDFRLAQQLAHTLKGVCGAIGATSVQHAAAALESALRAERTDEAADLAARLEGAFGPLVEGLRAWGEQAAAGGASLADGQAPGPVMSPQEVQALVDRLAMRLEAFDPEAADIAESLASHFAPETEAVAQLVRQARDFEFEDALKTLQGLKGTL